MITGASSGLGKALAEALARRGHTLFLVARRKEKLQALQESLEKEGRKVHCFPCDLTDERERRQMLQQLKERSPSLIINNAGIGLYGAAWDLSPKEWEEQIALNVSAVVDITLTLAHTLRREKKTGTILNISSLAGQCPFPYFSLYSAGKAFVSSFSQACDVEMRPWGIRVLTACPGQIKTPFIQTASKGGIKENTSFLAMPVERAVNALLRQIDRKRRIQIFDWKARCLAACMHWVPQAWRNALLSRGIQRRSPTTHQS